MNLRKSAHNYLAFEENIKRLKLKGYSDADIAAKLGTTENRVSQVLKKSLESSKLCKKKFNDDRKKIGLPGFETIKVTKDWSALAKLGEAVKNYTETEIK